MSKQRSPRNILGVWLIALVSLPLLAVAGRTLASDIGSFRSCNSNSNGLVVRSCGKHGLNAGDLILFVFFVLAAVLAVSFWTAAVYTISRRRK
ncbi:MAG TPA: hypothetical protein VHB51_02735 [Candidatus Saccharimonadales bacterium]|nr:hypothetical protein [Candidatus Saccharimonadales bacterium]